ncbi:OLC1v1038327C8, partial [Oldenlandia corymbosa var. corymbosa]
MEAEVTAKGSIHIISGGLGIMRFVLVASTTRGITTREEVIIKTRKPYTITKQRERWTEEEHNRFLEALKLYGRAWQRIEEHIGTKTAVQIRSHAQKFFTKLEKEALLKGIPMGQALDIEIPPPRPKRKPSNPYPRKTINSSVVHMELKDGKPMHPTSFRHQAEQMIDLEKEPLPEKVGDQSIGNGEENPAGDKLPGKDLAIQGSPDTSSSVNKSSLPTSTALRKSYVSNEFISVLNEVANMDESIESHVTVEARANKQADELCTMQSSGKSSMDKGEDLANSHPLDEKLAQSKENQLGQSEKFEKYPKNDWQSVENQARHVSVQILDGSLGMAAPKVSHSESCQEPVFYKMVGVEPKTSTNPSTSGTSEQYVGAARFSINQPFAGIQQPMLQRALLLLQQWLLQLHVPPGINQETADTSIDIRGENIDPALESQHEKSEFFKAQLQEQHSTSKSPSLPLSDRGEDKDLKSSNGATPKKTEQATAGTAE